MLQKSARGSDPVESIFPMTQCFWTFASIFFYCHFGEMVSHQFNAFCDELYQRNWYFYSIEMQRVLAIFMIDAGQTVFLQGYANVVCNRDAFKNVTLVSGAESIATLISSNHAFLFAFHFRPSMLDVPIL